MDSTTSNIDVFIQYDSSTLDTDDGMIDVDFKTVGSGSNTNKCKVTISGTSLTFPQNYVPSTVIGYIGLVGFSQTQPGTSCLVNGKSSRGKVLFPLRDPASGIPDTEVHNIVYIQPQDSFRVAYFDETMTEIVLDRIVTTIYITTKT